MIIPEYNPLDWYWAAEDGRLFASARATSVQPSDKEFAAWKASGRAPTAWPRDDAGAQTDAALQEVLAPYGISVTSAPAVPQSVTRAQAKIAMHRAGILEAVKTAVAGDPEMQIWFDDAITWERKNPHIVALGEGALTLSEEQIDELFIAAAKIAA